MRAATQFLYRTLIIACVGFYGISVHAEILLLKPVKMMPKPAATPVPIPKPARSATPINLPKPVVAPINLPKPAATPVPIPQPARSATPINLPKPAAAPINLPKPAATPVPIPQPARSATPINLPKPAAAPINLPKKTAATPVPIPKPADRVTVNRDIPRINDHKIPQVEHPFIHGAGLPGLPGGREGSSAAGGSTGFGGAPENPYGSFDEPGQGSSSNPIAGFEESGPPQVGPPAGTKNPGAQLMEEIDRVTKHGENIPSTPLGYGSPVIPGKDPGGGMVAKPSKMETTYKAAYGLFQMGLLKSVSMGEFGDQGGDVNITDNEGNEYTYNFDSAGKLKQTTVNLKNANDIHIIKNEGSSGKGTTTLGGGGSGGIAGKKKLLYEQTKLLGKDPVVGGDRSSRLLDNPLHNTDNSSGEEGTVPAGNMAQAARQAPEAKKNYSGAGPGAGLIGPSDAVTDKAAESKQVILPKGFHVIDPANKAAAEANMDAQMGLLPSPAKQ